MRTCVVVAIILFFAACSDNAKVPKDIIQKDKMQKVLWDMIQADRFTNDFLPKRGDSAYNEIEILKVYQKVFNVHGITRADFLKSYSFYLNHPDISKVLFDSITTQAEKKRNQVYESTSKTDSLNKQLIKDSLKRYPSILDSTRKLRLDSMRTRLGKNQQEKN